MHSLSSKEKQKCIEDYVGSETAVARKPVVDTETAIMQEQQDQRNTEIKGVTTREPEKTFEQMMITNLDIVSDLPSSDKKQDTDD